MISLYKQLWICYTQLALPLIMRCLQLKFSVSRNKLPYLHALRHIMTVVHPLNPEVRQTVA
jgi:hypothetical protein